MKMKKINKINHRSGPIFSGVCSLRFSLLGTYINLRSLPRDLSSSVRTFRDGGVRRVGEAHGNVNKSPWRR
jgi:hypothetical protein